MREAWAMCDVWDEANYRSYMFELSINERHDVLRWHMLMGRVFGVMH